MNYYNEFDRKAAEWLRVLIREGHIAPGDVDERSIVDVQPTDLAGYVQCHFFSGVGGWSLALRLAGWPNDKEAWTGSCPCQPFSVAGKGLGTADERHLWPEFRRLITECKPPVVFGEQVASALGRVWLAGVRTDLEALAYSVGAADLCAAGIRAPHIRQRLYWVADSHHGGWLKGNSETESRTPTVFAGQSVPEFDGVVQRNGAVGAWSDFDVIPFRDGKARRIESGTFPLADGIPGRVGLLRGYGNAIVPQLAAEFIKAFLDTQK